MVITSASPRRSGNADQDKERVNGVTNQRSDLSCEKLYSEHQSSNFDVNFCCLEDCFGVSVLITEKFWIILKTQLTKYDYFYLSLFGFFVHSRSRNVIIAIAKLDLDLFIVYFVENENLFCTSNYF